MQVFPMMFEEEEHTNFTNFTLNCDSVHQSRMAKHVQKQNQTFMLDIT